MPLHFVLRSPQALVYETPQLSSVYPPRPWTESSLETAWVEPLPTEIFGFLPSWPPIFHTCLPRQPPPDLFRCLQALWRSQAPRGAQCWAIGPFLKQHHRKQQTVASLLCPSICLEEQLSSWKLCLEGWKNHGLVLWTGHRSLHHRLLPCLFLFNTD